MPIFSPIPTRARLSQLAEAGSSTTSIAVEVDTDPHDVLADLDAYVFRRSTAEVAITERRRQHLALRLRQHLLKRPEKEETGGAAKEKERRDQIRTEHRARKTRERRFQASSTDALADDLSTLCTSERDRADRGESTQRVDGRIERIEIAMVVELKNLERQGEIGRWGMSSQAFKAGGKG